MQIFVVSLKDSKRRRTEITNQMKKFGLDFEFFDAVDCRSGVPKKYEALVDRNLAKQKLRRFLADAEIGCALSHSFLYKKIIQEKIQQAIILEDDVILNNDFANVVKNKILENSKYNFVMLYHSCAKRLPFRFGKKLYNEFKVYKSFTNAYGTVGYYINYLMAEQLYSATTPISYTADWPIDVKEYAVYASPILLQHLPPGKRTSYISAGKIIEESKMHNKALPQQKTKIPKYIGYIFKISYLSIYCLALVVKKLFNINLFGKNTDEKIVLFKAHWNGLKDKIAVDIANKT